MGSLTENTYRNGMQMLEAAFSADLKAETVKVYWQILKTRISDEYFIETIEDVIVSERFFPTVSTILKYSKHSTVDEILKKYGLGV